MKVTAFFLGLFLWLSIFPLFSQEKESKNVVDYSNITEAGLTTISPRGVCIEGTSVNGISINKHHHLGIGVGYGGSFLSSYSSATAYTPVFLNYRFYFKPDQSFTPHVNLSVGGLLAKDGAGIYSSFTAGFRVKKFSFSSGISFIAIYRREDVLDYFYPYYDPYYAYYDPYSYPYSVSYTRTRAQWHYPFGITIKCGFSL